MRAARQHAQFARVVESVGQAYLSRLEGGGGDLTAVYSELVLGDLNTMTRTLEAWLLDPGRFRKGEAIETTLRTGTVYARHDISADADTVMAADQSPVLDRAPRVVRHRIREQ
ncbi:hypothetical protein OG474_13500 [Kribbella sp. NBC_01505]|uniref:hypothetical protein n=1 Tax=Kribbella sp. NBC_01505 TaxID=2903580 RepID=UPI00386D0CD6